MRRLALIAISLVVAVGAVVAVAGPGSSRGAGVAVPGPGDLRERGVCGRRRGRADRRRGRRQHPVARRDPRPAPCGRDALDRRRALHAVLRQRDMLDPPAVADRRALRRLRPGPLELAAAPADQTRSGHRQPLPAGDPHDVAGGRRHRPGHLSAADRTALLADPQRARHRPRGPRLRPQRHHPSRQPGARLHRPGAEDPGAPEPPARPARDRLRQGARAAGEGQEPDRRVRHAREHDIGRQRGPRQGHLALVPAVPAVPAPAAAADGLAGQPRRPGNAADGVARPERVGARTPVPEPGAVCQAGAAGPDRARQLIPAIPGGAGRHRAARRASSRASARRRCRRRRRSTSSPPASTTRARSSS